MDAAAQRLEARAPRLTIKIEQDATGGIVKVGPEHSDRQGFLVRLEDAFGTHGAAFAPAQINYLISACQDKAGKIDTVKFNGMIAAIDGARPTNEIQAMLAVQMAMTHAAALDVLRREAIADVYAAGGSAGEAATRR
jgi:hypothetical protein